MNMRTLPEYIQNTVGVIIYTKNQDNDALMIKNRYGCTAHARFITDEGTYILIDDIQTLMDVYKSLPEGIVNRFKMYN